MQVLENAVKKLKMPSNVEEVSTRIEPRFETTGREPADAKMASAQEPSASSDPVSISSVRTAPPPPAGKPRGPLFADLPDPEFGDDASMTADTSGSGGGGAGAKPDDKERRFGPWLTGLGAVASLALIVVVSVWTYKLGQRDAREVPVVAALEGPARVAPQDAGGLQVAHQGHSVNTVLEGRGVEAVASEVTIAPADNDLTPEDAPTSQLKALVASRTPLARPADEPEAQVSDNMAGSEPDASAPLMPNGTIAVSTKAGTEAAVETPSQTVAALAPQIEIAAVKTPATFGDTGAQIVTPRDEIAAIKPEVEAIAPPIPVSESAKTGAADVSIQPAELEVASLGPLPPLGEGSVYAPALMKLPEARPADLNAAMANAVNAALEMVLAESTASPDIVKPEPAQAPVQVAEAQSALDVIPLPGGTRMIQIGAYGSEAIARQQWDRLSSQHDDLLASKDHYVQRTNNSGKIFYRLRVSGYQSKGDTLAACAALSARGLPCITVTLP